MLKKQNQLIVNYCLIEDIYTTFIGVKDMWS